MTYQLLDDDEDPLKNSDEPLDQNYARRQYYGTIPIDGETYSHKLNASAKIFVMSYLRARFEQLSRAQEQRNDIDFREVVSLIHQTESKIE